jgi:hypothetical protein
LKAQYRKKGFSQDKRDGSAWWISILYNVLGAKALPYILDGSLGHIVDEIEYENNFGCEWTYEVNLEETTLETWKGEKQIGLRKFKDLTIDYMRKLEYIDNDQ